MEEAVEFVGDGFAVGEGEADVVMHRAAVVAADARVDGDLAGGHFAEGPLPDIVFFKGA